MKVLIYVVPLLHLATRITGETSTISPKLDFGELPSNNYDSSLSTSLVKALVRLRQTTGLTNGLITPNTDDTLLNLHSATPLAQSFDKKDDFTSLGIVCIDGNCNKTNVKRSNGDKLSTDVLVQVVTNVQNKENKSVGTGNNDVPVVVGRSDLKPTTGYNSYAFQDNARSDGNQFQYQLPHFEPMFNNHYFGEMSPPQFTWYRQRPVVHNPNMFIANARPYKPFGQWQLRYPTNPIPTHTPSGWTPTTSCTCTNPGLNWYPNSDLQKPISNPSISDKMSPLI